MHVNSSYWLANNFREVGLPHIAAFLEFIGDNHKEPIVFDVAYVDPSSPIVGTAATASLTIADPYEYFYSIFAIEVPEEMVHEIEMGLAFLELCCTDYLEAQGCRTLH
jgi:hypothetical protein